MSRRWIAIAVLALAAAALIALPAGAAESGTPNATASKGKAKRVSIKGFAFKPKTLRVSRGTRVAFKNFDSARHNAVDRGEFSTGTLRKGQSKTIKFKERGTYRFICTFHPFMKGKIVVR